MGSQFGAYCCYTRYHGKRCGERLSVNFQDIHTYYQQLNIGQFFPHMLCKGEALTVAANKNSPSSLAISIFALKGR